MTDTETRPLPTIGAWRPASRLREGWQILALQPYEADGTEDWWTVTRVMHITGPLKISHFHFDNGASGGVVATDEFFCRTPTEIKRAAAVAR